jgi:hypothetical protein
MKDNIVDQITWFRKLENRITEESKMNQLDKVIKQFETETGELAKPNYMTSYDEKFVLWLASRPICGKEQRLFLDEIEKGYWSIHSKSIILNLI